MSWRDYALIVGVVLVIAYYVFNPLKSKDNYDA